MPFSQSRLNTVKEIYNIRIIKNWKETDLVHFLAQRQDLSCSQHLSTFSYKDTTLGPDHLLHYIVIKLWKYWLGFVLLFFFSSNIHLSSCKLSSYFSLRTNTGVCLLVFRYALHIWTQVILALVVRPELILYYFVNAYFCKVNFVQVARHTMFSNRLFLLYHILQQVFLYWFSSCPKF